MGATCLIILTPTLEGILHTLMVLLIISILIHRSKLATNHLMGVTITGVAASSVQTAWMSATVVDLVDHPRIKMDTSRHRVMVDPSLRTRHLGGLLVPMVLTLPVTHPKVIMDNTEAEWDKVTHHTRGQ